MAYMTPGHRMPDWPSLWWEGTEVQELAEGKDTAMLSTHEFASCWQAMSKAYFECGIAQVSLGLQQHPTMVAILSFLKTSLTLGSVT